MTWHAEAPALARYRAREVSAVQASSLEAHLLACAECRDRLAGLTTTGEQARLDVLWAGIVDLADAPTPDPAERLLRRLGVPNHLGRLLAATPSLTASWLAGVVASLAFSVLAARAGTGDRGMMVFLVIAPLLPLAGVAAAFGPRVEPAHEIGVAAPMHGFRLLLIRATAVLSATFLFTGVASLAVPAGDWRLVAWLLPALALATCTLAVATWFPIVPSAAALAATWVTLALGSIGLRALRFAPPDDLLDRSLAFRPAGQIGFALLALVAGTILARRRHYFEIGGLT
jgi:hypothetical protein